MDMFAKTAKRTRCSSGASRFVDACRFRREGSGEDEQGFTLIELLIVLVILPMVIGAVAIVMITTLKATVPNDFHGHNKDLQSTSQRLAESHDTQQTSAFFVRDVQNSRYLATNSALLNGCGSGTQLLGLTWNSGPSAITVTYAKTTIAGNSAVVRNFCEGGPTSPTTVSHNISASTPPSVTLLCNQTIDLGNTCATDAASAPISTLRVDTVELDITESSGYVFRLIASPRQSLANATLLSASTPALLLADGGNCGTGNIAVNGTAAVNYGTLQFQNNNGSFAAQQVYEGATTVNDGVLQSGSKTVKSATGPFVTGPDGKFSDSPQIGEPISGTGIPSNATVGSVTSATQATMSSAATSNQTNDSITIGPNTATNTSTGSPQVGTPISDPYSNLPAPSSTGADTHVESSLFKPSGALTPGIYIIQAGLSVGGGGSVTTGAALPDGTNGVFFYVTGGSVTLGGSSNISLSAITAGPYAATYGGILLYQVASDTSGMTLDGSSSATTLNGVIAAPGATVTLNGGGSSSGLQANGLEAASISCNGNNTTTVLGPPVSTSVSTNSVPDPSASGAQVTFTATVSSALAGVTPTGTVTFTITQAPTGVIVPTTMCATVPLNSGVATCQYSGMVVAGSYTVTESYNPSPGFSSSSGTRAQSVNPLAVVSSLTLSNHAGGTAGKVEAGDKITVVFGQAMNASTICAAWPASPGATQSLSGLDVTLTQPDNATDSSMNVASSVNANICGAGNSFHFGSIDLGAPKYDGNGNSASSTEFMSSSVTYNPSTNTLVITLGAASNNKPNAVTTPTKATYTPDAAIQSSTGLTVASYTQPSATEQF